MKKCLVAVAAVVACNSAEVKPSAPAAAPVAASAPVTLSTKAVPLPGATGPVSLDYIAFDRAANRLWVPAGDTGSVDAFDVASGKMTRIEGFPTVEKEANGRKRKMGPSSASMGAGVVYVGNRANSEVCSIDSATLTKGACATLESSPDGMQYVALTSELWITTPHTKSLTILDAALKPKGTVVVDGSPEGYAVDQLHGFFYTNLEDQNRTLRIDLTTRKVVASWKADCGEAGPRGIALDPARNLGFVACTDHIVTIDTAHDGAYLFRADTGAGVDNIDYLPAKQQLFVASGKAARLTVFGVDDHGALRTIATAPTAEGSRSVVADAAGNSYVIDPAAGQILVAPAP